MTIQDIAAELESKGYRTVTEPDLRQVYSLPNWVAIPPLFVQLLNEHLGTVTVGPEQETTEPPNPPPQGRKKASPNKPINDIFDLAGAIFQGALSGDDD